MTEEVSAAAYAAANVARLEILGEKLQTAHADLLPVFAIRAADGELRVPAAQLHAAAADLKQLGFERLDMITAVDRADHFELVYRLQSSSFGVGILMKTDVPRDDAVIDTLVDLWPGADWQEREVYDLVGVDFRDHPNLRRILLPDDWEGHPLRKDYHDDSVVPRPDYI